MESTEARLLKVFEIVFPDLSTAEIRTASQSSVSQWDSVATVTLVAVIEEEFGVVIEPAELEEFVSFRLVHDLIASKLKK